MKNMLKSLLVVSALAFCAPQAALAEGYGAGVASKFAHGLANTALGVGELPKEMIVETSTKGLGYGLTTGVFLGILYGVARTGAGLIDLVTFPLPSEPLVTPGYIWEDFTTEPTRLRADWI